MAFKPESVRTMIKILFFIEQLGGGGAEKVLCNLVNEMDQSRFDITVQTLWKAEAGQYLKPGIRYRYCYEKKNKLNVFRSRLEAAAGLTYPLHIRDDYDIEVAYLECGATKILAGSTNKKAKKIAWVHSDMEQKQGGRPKTARKTGRQYAAYDRIVCVSRTVRESFVRMFGRERDAVILYNTVDDAAIREKATALLPDFPEKKRLTVVSVGRLSPEKQFDMLLRVHRELRAEGLAHDLWIVGEGSRRVELEKQIEENGLTDTVRLCGYQTNPYPYMAAADLLVCSSRYEGLSTFVTEGLILGKPILTTECSGMRELLGDSEYGLITDNAEEALLAGMRRMLADGQFREQYGKMAVSRGKAFSSRETTATTESFFMAVLQDSSS